MALSGVPEKFRPFVYDNGRTVRIVNMLRTLPEWLRSLPNLTTLNLTLNGLTELPEWVGTLPPSPS